MDVLWSINEIQRHSFRLSHWFVFYWCGHILADAVFLHPAVPDSVLAVLTAVRLKMSGGEIGSGPSNVAVPKSTGLEGGTVK